MGVVYSVENDDPQPHVDFAFGVYHPKLKSSNPYILKFFLGNV